LTATTLHFGDEFEEVNPVMREIINRFGLVGMFVFKLIGVLFVLWAMGRCEVSKSVWAYWIWIYACVFTGMAVLSGVISNAFLFWGS
jgi:hypothetical protein